MKQGPVGGDFSRGNQPSGKKGVNLVDVEEVDESFLLRFDRGLCSLGPAVILEGHGGELEVMEAGGGTGCVIEDVVVSSERNNDRVT